MCLPIRKKTEKCSTKKRVFDDGNCNFISYDAYRKPIQKVRIKAIESESQPQLELSLSLNLDFHFDLPMNEVDVLEKEFERLNRTVDFLVIKMRDKDIIIAKLFANFNDAHKGLTGKTLCTIPLAYYKYEARRVLGHISLFLYIRLLSYSNNDILLQL